MAAGRGSRYGGAKQVAGVGPAGERLLEYAVFDARQAGFRRIVFITRPDLVDEFTTLTHGLPRDLEYEIVTQPASARSRHGVVLNRAKPWGTVHAVLAARSALPMPFAIVNADDFYGRMTYSLAAAACREADTSGRFALVGMRLDHTLSPSGPVARGALPVMMSSCGSTRYARSRGLPRAFTARFPTACARSRARKSRR
jgi:CTP:molybdopterin cytidylyltransferase MocA